MPWLLLAHGTAVISIDPDPRRMASAALVAVLTAAYAAAPSLLIGLLIAGILDRMVGAATLRRLFGTGGWGGPLRAWAIGLVLPTCSLGVLPIARALSRAGIARGTVLSFLLVAPVLNPFSLVFGLSMLGPGLLLKIVLGSSIVSTACGALCNARRSDDDPVEGIVTPAVPATGLRRPLAAGLHAADDLSGPMVRDLALAALGVALLGAILPGGWLQAATAPSRPTGPLLLALAVTPAYVGPLEAMRHAGVIIRDGYAPIFAVVLLAFGAGLNLAVLGELGLLLRRRLVWPVLAFVVLFVGGEYTLDALGRRVPPGTVLHTHALDDFGRSPSKDGSERAILEGLSGTKPASGRVEGFATVTLIILASTGVVLRSSSLGGGIRSWLDAPDDQAFRRGPSMVDLVIPRSWLIAVTGAIAIGGLLGLVLIHYPSPAEQFEEMDGVSTGVQYAVAHGPRDEAVREIRRWETMARRLEPGVLLRRGRLDPELREAVTELGYGLQMLRELVEAGRDAEARASLRYVSEAYRECRHVATRP